jgi:hypothetical protein
MSFKIFRIGFLIALLTGCTSEAPEPLELSSINWMRYSSVELGVELRVPDTWSIEEHEDDSGVIFRQDGYPVLAISLLDENQARERGLWADHEPIGEDIFMGQPAQSYRYDHQDVLYILPTLSWVIPWRSRFLEVAFRTSKDQVDITQQAILGNFRLLDLES